MSHITTKLRLLALITLIPLAFISTGCSDNSGRIKISSIDFIDENLEDCVDDTDLKYIDELKYLKCEWQSIENLKGINALTSLTKLELLGNDIEDLSNLSTMTSLNELDLSYNRANILSPLASLSNLNTLIIRGNKIEDVNSLANLKNLAVLILDNNKIKDIHKLSALTNLEHLGLDENKISNINSLSTLTDLTYLGLRRNQISDIGSITKLTNLKELYLEENQIKDIGNISNLNKLEILNLDNNLIENIDKLETITSLKVLLLENNSIASVNKLSKLINLTEVRIENNKITDISALSSLTNLKDLYIGGNQILDVSSLTNLPNLSALQLSDETVVLDLNSINSKQASKNGVCDNPRYEKKGVSATTPNDDFTIHENGTVTHNTTGLMWMRCSLGQVWTGNVCLNDPLAYEWEDAFNEAKESSFAGYSDWRLPAGKELASIIEARCSQPSINNIIFPNTSSDRWFWSSIPWIRQDEYSGGVSFFNGKIGFNPNSFKSQVRLVRAGKQILEHDMVTIPAGSFKMGCSDKTDCRSSEKPVHTVTLKSFEMSKYEVTYAQWDICYYSGGCEKYPRDWGDIGRGYRPVNDVSWGDIQQYIKWLNSQTGKKYSLPTEAQWEYAARAGSTTKYHWGNELGENNAHCDSCKSPWDGRHPTIVGYFEPNAWGLYDMHGNVSEYTLDCWNENFKEAPTDGSAWKKGYCDTRVTKGGSYYGGNNGNLLRSAFRFLANEARIDTGFRLVINLNQE